MTHFAIIGAGLSGVSLAERLSTAGHQVTIFEKSRGLGGRLATRRREGWQADHGAQYFTARDAGFKKAVQQWQSAGWVAPWSVTPYTLQNHEITPSPDDQTRWVGVSTMNAMVHGLSNGLDVNRGVRVGRVERVNQQWLLSDDQNQLLGEFDALIISAPQPQAAELIPKTSTLAMPVNESTMSPTWSVAIAFKAPTTIKPDAVFVKNEAISWLARDSSKPSRATHYETWMVHFSSTFTEQHLDESKEALYQQALNQLKRLNESQPLPEVHDYFAHRWLYARSAQNERINTQWSADEQLGLVGDWTVGGRLENAWLSAKTLADEILG